MREFCTPVRDDFQGSLTNFQFDTFEAILCAMPPFHCITKRNLQTLAGERWFNRGEVYRQQGRVTDLIIRGESLSANVAGAEAYRVRLSCRNNRLTYSCTCPLGA